MGVSRHRTLSKESSTDLQQSLLIVDLARQRPQAYSYPAGYNTPPCWSLQHCHLGHGSDNDRGNRTGQLCPVSFLWWFKLMSPIGFKYLNTLFPWWHCLRRFRGCGLAGGSTWLGLRVQKPHSTVSLFLCFLRPAWRHELAVFCPGYLLPCLPTVMDS